MRKFQILAASAALLSATAFTGLLSSCEKQAQDLPEPATASSDIQSSHNPGFDLLLGSRCDLRAVVRAYTTADSCRGFVLQLADSSRTRLRPTGALWQSFRPRNGQRVRFGYVPVVDSTGCRGPVSLVGRPVRLTCIRPDSAGFKAPGVRPSMLTRGLVR